MTDVTKKIVRKPVLNLYKGGDIKPLYINYMSFVTNGGFFIPTKRPYKMGDQVDIHLVIEKDGKHFIPLSGKVIWITPDGCDNHNIAGIGIQLSHEDGGRAKHEIETKLAKTIKYTATTNTM